MEVVQSRDDARLIEALKNEKTTDEAIRNLYRSYYQSLSWYVLNNSGSEQDAEDIFQEVMIAFIDLVRKGKFRGESSVKTFLYSMNRHFWLNELKKRGRAQAREEKFESMQDRRTEDLSETLAGRESGKQVMDVLEKLGENCRRILFLYYYEELSMKEILEQMHYENEQVVRNKKYKCIRELERMINNDPPLKQALKSILHG